MFLGLSTESWINIIATIVGLGIVGKVWKYLRTIAKGVQYVVSEVTPNGGSSTKDKINKALAILDDQNKVLERHTNEISEVKEKIQTRNDFKDELVREIKEAIGSSHQLRINK